MLFFTISSNNYLAQAITLGNSLAATNPGSDFMIGLIDKREPAVDYSMIPFEIIEADRIGISDFDELCLKYSITELSTSVKPFFFSYFFKSAPDSQIVVYLDPDIMVFGSFDLLEAELRDSDIIITPHFTSPINDNYKQSEEDFLNSGLYNLGFIALKNTAESSRMLSWWGERLRHKAYIDLERGLFTDQIWINFVPLFFKGVRVLLHPGYNVAYWNLHERRLKGKEVVTGDGETWPLVFFHFSGYSPLLPDVLSKYQTRFSFENREDVKEYFDSYSQALIANGFMSYSKIAGYYSLVKGERERRQILEKIKAIPLYKRLIRKFILKTVSFFNIVLDYSKL